MGLAATGRPHHEDVRLGDFDRVVLFASSREGSARLDSLVVVVYGNRERLLGLVLTDYVFAKKRVNLFGLWQVEFFDLLSQGLAQLFFDDLVAELDALVADIDARAGD